MPSASSQPAKRSSIRSRRSARSCGHSSTSSMKGSSSGKPSCRRAFPLRSSGVQWLKSSMAYSSCARVTAPSLASMLSRASTSAIPSVVAKASTTARSSWLTSSKPGIASISGSDSPARSTIFSSRRWSYPARSSSRPGCAALNFAPSSWPNRRGSSGRKRGRLSCRRCRSVIGTSLSRRRCSGIRFGLRQGRWVCRSRALASSMWRTSRNSFPDRTMVLTARRSTRSTSA